MKNRILKALPYVTAVVVFWVVSALYFAPQLSGDTLAMGDVTMYGGMKADIVEHRAATGEDPQWTGGMFGGMPAYSISVLYPAMILRNAVQWAMGLLGEPMALMFLAMLGFWLMLLMCGVNAWLAIPFALAYGLSTYNILIIEAGHITKMRAMGYAPMLVGAVWWTFRRNMWVGGALAALFGTLQIAAAHPQITYYFLLVILALWINEFVVTIRDTKWGKDVRRTGVYPDGNIVVGIKVRYFPISGSWDRFWKATGVLVIAAILAVGANFTHLWYTLEHASDTTRGGSEVVAEVAGGSTGGLDLNYATAWSYGVGESLNMFIPNLRGGASSNGFAANGAVAEALEDYGAAQMAVNLPAYTGVSTYWGEQPGTGGPTYLGAVMVFLFVLGMFVLPARQKWWVLAVSVFALFLAWGRNAMWFTELSFSALPGYNKFRTVAMALAVLQWSVPFVAALVASGLWKGQFTEGIKISEGVGKARFMKGLAWSSGITGGVALLLALCGGMIFDFAAGADFDRLKYFALGNGFDNTEAETFADHILSAVSVERMAIMKADSWRALLFVCLTAAVVWSWISWRGEKAVWRRWIPVVALSALVLVDLVPIDLRFLSHDDFGPRTKAEVKPGEANKQIMADTEPGFRVLNVGYDDPQNLKTAFNEAYTSYFHRSVGGYHAAKLSRYQDVIDRYLSRFHPGVLNMLNTKYYIVDDPATGMPAAELNGDAFGAAWFVSDVAFVDGAAAELEALEKTNLRQTAIVDRRFEALARISAGSSNDSKVELTEYRPNYLKYETSTISEQVAVFSEIYYDKGWKAYVDGVETPYFRADYILRAMVVPAGEHTVEWRFRAPRFALVEGVTLGSSIAILLWLAAAIFFDRRKKLTDNGS